jgi:hypothetical protein
VLDAIARNLELSTEGLYEQGARRRAEQDDDEEGNRGGGGDPRLAR